jgi:sigma-54 interacting transcriptional regulator
MQVFPKDQQGLLSEKLRRLRVVAYGCHDLAIQKLDAELHHIVHQVAPADAELGRFFFCEFLSLTPVKRSDAGDNRLKKVQLIAPFLDRDFHSHDFAFDYEQIKQMATWSKTEVERLDDLIWNVEADGQTRWYEPPVRPAAGVSLMKVLTEYSTFGSLEMTHLGKLLFCDWRDSERRAQVEMLDKEYDRLILLKDIRDKLRVKAVKYLNMFCQIYLPWAKGAEPSAARFMRFVGVPIATKEIFYGYILIVFPYWRNLPNEDWKNLFKQSAALLDESVVRKNYLPTLTLFQNSWDEFVVEWQLQQVLSHGRKRLNSKWLAGIADQYQLVFPNLLRSGRSKVTFDRAFSASNPKAWPVAARPMEAPLCDLWRRRAELLDKGKAKSCMDTLLFAEKMYASPGMVDAISRVMNLRITRQKKAKSPVPTALVVGDPGSGKETIANLIPLFSSDFFQARKHPVNLAALRPSILAGPLLVGLGEAVPQPLQAQGLFHSAVLQRGVRHVFLLDELNSLDIDSQGVLLRILEQGEIVKIGGLLDEGASKDKEGLPWLVIGIMNEDPRRLTLEPLIAKVREEALFGELLGSLLYEKLREARRLREDLYHRVRRSGEVHLPSLDERRYDLPVLFYNLLLKDLNVRTDATGSVAPEDGFLSGEGIYVEYAALKALTDPAVRWEGNIRQLQVMTKHISRQILARRDLLGRKVRTGKRPPETYIDRHLIDDALRFVTRSS